MKRLTFLALILMTSSGCADLMHNLQPHRLWRFNYYDSPGRSDNAYFSVQDDLSQPVTSAAQLQETAREE